MAQTSADGARRWPAFAEFHGQGPAAAAPAAISSDPPMITTRLSFEQVSTVKTECAMEMHNVALKWVRRYCEVRGLPYKQFGLAYARQLKITPVIKSLPNNPEAYEFM